MRSGRPFAVTQSLLIEFCVRLACGLACMMVCTSARAVGVQFFRTLMLIVLGLSVLALLAGPGLGEWIGLLSLGSAILAFLGFVLWSLGRVLGGQCVSALLLACGSVALIVRWWPSDSRGWAACLVGAGEAVTSTLLLGSTVAAMLLGHSYLIAPAMSIEPLKRLVLWIGGSLAGRAAAAGLTLALSSRDGGGGLFPVNSSSFWWTLQVTRWLIGLVGPAIMAWMVWHTMRIRATQSATGILYAAVILTFIGELMAELLKSPSAVAM